MQLRSSWHYVRLVLWGAYTAVRRKGEGQLKRKMSAAAENRAFVSKNLVVYTQSLPGIGIEARFGLPLVTEGRMMLLRLPTAEVGA